MTRTRGCVLWVGLLLLLLTGCGPVKSTLMIRDAEAVLSQATADEADQKVASVYYYWAAHEYLVKAKVTHGHAEFFRSEEMAAKSLDLAQKALEKSKGATLRVVEPDADSLKAVEPEPPVEAVVQEAGTP